MDSTKSFKVNIFIVCEIIENEIDESENFSEFNFRISLKTNSSKNRHEHERQLIYFIHGIHGYIWKKVHSTFSLSLVFFSVAEWLWDDFIKKLFFLLLFWIQKALDKFLECFFRIKLLRSFNSELKERTFHKNV